MTSTNKLSPEVRGDASPVGSSDQGARKDRRLIRSPAKTPSKERLHAGTGGTKGKPNDARERIKKLSAPPTPRQQSTPARDRSAHSSRGKPTTSLSPTVGSSPSQRGVHRDALAASPGRFLRETTNTHPLSTQSARSPVSGTPRLSCPTPSGSLRGVPASRALLLTARETTWVSAGRKGMSEASNASYGRPAAHPSSAKQNEPTPMKKAAIFGFVSFVTIFLLAAVIIIVVVTSKVPPLHPAKGQYCDTMDCRFHAKLLTANLNASINPCEDFSAYVCSLWSPSDEHREHIKTPVDFVTLFRLAGFRMILEEGTRKLPSGVKALNMHKSCMRQKDHRGFYLSDFRTLMRDMGLSWPELPRGDVNALDVLVALSYKWQVHLWIEVRVLAQPLTEQWRLLFAPASMLYVLMNQYQSVKDITSYSAYWMGYYQYFTHSTNADMSSSTPTANAKETRNTEGAILNSMDQFVIHKRKSPVVFRLESIGNHSMPITSATWMTILQRNIAVSPQLATDNDVQLSHEPLLKTIGRFFQDYPESKLLSQLSWTFVQQYAPIAESSMLLLQFGNQHKVNAYQPIFCGFHVETTYKVLLLSIDIAARIKETQKVSIDAGFQRLVSAAARKVDKSSWLDDESKRVARDKVTSVKMQVWPNEVLMENEVLEEIYKDYPSAEMSFAEHWMHARRSIRNASETLRFINDSQAYWDARGLPANFAPSYPIYDYVSNAIAVPINVLDRPLYYTEGTNAMFFGGLGYLLALNLVKALDEVGVRWLPNGTNVDSIFSDETKNTFQDKVSCLKPDGADSVFPDLPALEIAYDALEDADKTGNGSLPVQNGLPPVKAFFMTMCYMTCSLRGYKSVLAAECNNIARNSAAFASAFNCSASSKMNRNKKCAFFG